MEEDSRLMRFGLIGSPIIGNKKSINEHIDRKGSGKGFPVGNRLLKKSKYTYIDTIHKIKNLLLSIYFPF